MGRSSPTRAAVLAAALALAGTACGDEESDGLQPTIVCLACEAPAIAPGTPMAVDVEWFRICTSSTFGLDPRSSRCDQHDFRATVRCGDVPCDVSDPDGSELPEINDSDTTLIVTPRVPGPLQLTLSLESVKDGRVLDFDLADTEVVEIDRLSLDCATVLSPLGLGACAFAELADQNVIVGITGLRGNQPVLATATVEAWLDATALEVEPYREGFQRVAGSLTRVAPVYRMNLYGPEIADEGSVLTVRARALEVEGELHLPYLP